MNTNELTADQLRRAAAIKDQIDALGRELNRILDTSGNAASKKKSRTMSSSVKRKIAATQKARWAKIKGSKPAARSVPSKKKSMSAATKAKLSARLKAIWAAKKAGKK
jgi:hypothetical protein